MTDGWNGQGGTDLERIKSESLVFQDQPTMTLKVVEKEPAPAVGGFAGEFAELVKEVELCRAGHCAAAYNQNSIGGQARYVVQKIARVVGLPLGDAILGGNIWSPQNMARVIAAVQELVNEQDAHRQELAARDGKDTKTVAALRDVLVNLGEGV
ncbi:hypothetical protein [Streptomyces sp. NPDC004135]